MIVEWMKSFRATWLHRWTACERGSKTVVGIYPLRQSRHSGRRVAQSATAVIWRLQPWLVQVVASQSGIAGRTDVDCAKLDREVW